MRRVPPTCLTLGYTTASEPQTGPVVELAFLAGIDAIE